TPLISIFPAPRLRHSGTSLFRVNLLSPFHPCAHHHRRLIIHGRDELRESESRPSPTPQPPIITAGSYPLGGTSSASPILARAGPQIVGDELTRTHQQVGASPKELDRCRVRPSNQYGSGSNRSSRM